MSAPVPFPAGAVTPTRLGDEVAERIRRYIVDNGLTEGSRLPAERTLAERLGTSRATVSQALRMLAVMGLVDIRHGSGVYVRHDPGALIGTSLDLMVELEPGSMSELVEFRQFLERSVVERAPVSEAEAIRSAFEALVASEGVVERWIEADSVFHLSLVESTGNRYLAIAYEQAHRKILSATYADWVERGATPRWLRGRGLEGQIELHRRILEAVLSDDRQELLEALDHHEVELAHHLERAGNH